MSPIFFAWIVLHDLTKGGALNAPDKASFCVRKNESMYLPPTHQLTYRSTFMAPGGSPYNVGHWIQFATGWFKVNTPENKGMMPVDVF